jgi:hypothetical protein
VLRAGATAPPHPLRDGKKPLNSEAHFKIQKQGTWRNPPYPSRKGPSKNKQTNKQTNKAAFSFCFFASFFAKVWFPAHASTPAARGKWGVTPGLHTPPTLIHSFRGGTCADSHAGQAIGANNRESALSTTKTVLFVLAAFTFLLTPKCRPFYLLSIGCP